LPLRPEAIVNRRTVRRTFPFSFAGLALSGAVAVAWLAGGCGPAPISRPADSHTGTAPAPIASPAAEPVVAEPSADEPVSAAAWVSPGAVAPGSAAELRVRIRVAAGHYLHPAGAGPPFVSTSIQLVPNNAVRPEGDWKLTSGVDAAGRLSGVVEYRRRVRVVDDAAAAGRHDLVCNLTFQACTAELCWPPRVLQLTAPFTVNAAAVAAPNLGRTREMP
jgi:hypothetical protein